MTHDELVNFYANEVLEKKAEWVKPLITTAGGIAAGVAALLGANILQKSQVKKVVDLQQNIPRTKEDEIQHLKSVAGFRKMPHYIIDGVDNAVYVPPKAIPDFVKKKLGDIISWNKKKGKVRTAQVAQHILDASQHPQGGMLIGSKVNNQFTVAHELGHALAQNDTSFKSYIENSPKLLKPLSLLGSVAAVAGSFIKPKYAPHLLGGAIGLNTLSTISKYYNESQASKRGLDLLQKADANISDVGKQSLQQAAKTYLWPELIKDIGAPLAAAGTAALLHKVL